jgi:hypothetical protein
MKPMLFTLLRRRQKCLSKLVHKFKIAEYSKRDIFMSPAHILQMQRWHVWAAP